MSPAVGLSNQGKDDSDDYEYSLERKASIHIPEWLPRRFQKTGMAQTVLPYASILVWYCFNMTVVLSNRWIFTHLPLPTSLTLLHSVPLLAVCPPHCSPPSLLQLTGLIVSTILLATKPYWRKMLQLEEPNELDTTSAANETPLLRVLSFLPVAISLTGATRPSRGVLRVTVRFMTGNNYFSNLSMR